jgi:hypothetical protein
MVDDGVENKILMSVCVTVSVHGLSNEVDIKLSLVAVVKSNHVFTGVKDLVVMSKSNGVTVKVSFPGCDSSPFEDATPWECDFGSDIIVEDLL